MTTAAIVVLVVGIPLAILTALALLIKPRLVDSSERDTGEVQERWVRMPVLARRGHDGDSLDVSVLNRAAEPVQIGGRP